MDLYSFIKKTTALPEKGIMSTIALLDDDCTIPFIARYRKDATGSLDEVQIGDIVRWKAVFEELEKRKSTVLKAIKEQEALTEELSKKIEEAENLQTLEDLYLPFKKKKNTKAELARQNGLEPLAKIIMAQRAEDLQFIAGKYKNKNILSAEEALEGAGHVIAEWINERTDFRNLLRWHLGKQGMITSKAVTAKKMEEKAQTYKDYFDFSEAIQRCPSHRLLAVLRAENEGFIRIKLELDDEQVIDKIKERIIKSNNACSEQISLAINDSYKRLLFPAISNEILQAAKEKADDTAIEVFSKNLRQLLLDAPLGEKNIMGIDPGFKTGCKVVCLNRNGGLVHNETIFPHPPQNDKVTAGKKIISLVDAYKIEAIAIGNGTASRETEQFIKNIRFQKDLEVFVVNEAGASVYSASKIAREEFPDYDITVRGAVSIGRRLADPLAELVKIDSKSIGVGQYQHDVDQQKLNKALDTVVENCVNNVGVNINTASKSLLGYVSGIGPKLAENLVLFRNQQGPFTSREEIKKVPRLGGKAFEQSAGFLRIKNSLNPLDDSAVHPESYSLVNKIAKDHSLKVEQLIGNAALLKTLDPTKYAGSTHGLETVKDVLKELERPGLDPREKARVFSFNEDIKKIEDLRIGQLLPGIVNNITNFGCFVDLGIKESGLVHISNLADRYVSDPHQIVYVNQQVVVKVLEVDLARKRIQLTMNLK